MTNLQYSANGTITKNYTDAGSYHYEDANGNNPVLDNISHESGRYKKLAAVWVKEYFVSDHLGNTRVTFKVSPSLDIVENKHYEVYTEHSRSTFGLTIEGLSNAAGPDDDNRFTYNGKEIDKDLNWYHYGARFYDPQIGRWHVTDPADEFGSPYIFVANDPINAVDPDGMVTDYFLDNYGKVIGSIPSKSPDRYFAKDFYGKTGYGGNNWTELWHKFTLGTHNGSENDLPFTNGIIIEISMIELGKQVDFTLNKYSFMNPENSFPGGGLDFKSLSYVPMFNNPYALFKLGDKLFNKNEIGNVYWGYGLSQASGGWANASAFANFGSFLIGAFQSNKIVIGPTPCFIFKQPDLFDSPNENAAVQFGQDIQKAGY
jgi:RHS repeat-associated protein